MDTPTKSETLDAGTLFERYDHRLAAFLNRKGWYGDDVQEIVGRVFAHVHNETKGYIPGELSAFGWLKLLARQQAKQYRREMRLFEPLVDTDEKPAAVETSANPYESIEEKDAVRLANEAFRRLSPELGEALSLLELDNLSEKQIAQQLEVSVEVVYKRVSNGRRRYRELLRLLSQEDEPSGVREKPKAEGP